MYFYFLGSHPKLSMAELESVLGFEGLELIDTKIAASNLPYNINFLGGTIKIAELVAEINIDDNLADNLHQIILKNSPKTEGKLNLGISVYGKKMPPPEITKLAFELKKSLKPKLNLRLAPNRAQALDTAQLIGLKLGRAGLELNLISKKNKILVALTREIQNLSSYTLRDYERPARDARVGMLPPKLTQMMINLATAGKPSAEKVVLDPFCGTGVVLQEAMLAGFSAVGSDIEPRMIEFSRTNLEWVKLKFKIETDYNLMLGDATSTLWPKFNFVVSEVFLGRPLNKLPQKKDLDEIIENVNLITKKFLLNLRKQISDNNAAICLAVPAWRDGKKIIDLPLIDQLENLGYNKMSLKFVSGRDLIYFREDATVARRILLLKIKEK
jgi:tRNA G10  N-methylase Trm11